MVSECLPTLAEELSPEKKLAAYAALVGLEKMEALQKLGEELKGLKIQHINSARHGGGVAEMLSSLILLERALGLEASWEVITGSQDFFVYTKTLHNFLQGLPGTIDIVGTKIYWDTNQANYPLVDEEARVIIIHDPQPAGLIKFAPPEVRQSQKWLWRCHIQLSHEHTFIMNFLRSLIEAYDTAIFSSGKFLPAWRVPFAVILPWIDPLSEKNRELTPAEIEAVLKKYEIEDPGRKLLITLVSRFDPFKGHLYALEAFKIVRKEIPCQLLFVGGTASDDPENQLVFAQLTEKTKGIPDVHLLNLPPDSHLEVNAFQRAATIILQPSIKEGFGLTISEGMWKGKPVIGGNAGGIPAQITDGYNGFLISPGPEGVNEMVERITYLLQNPTFAQKMGERGKEIVRAQFLITRGVWDELNLIKNLLPPPPKYFVCTPPA